MAGEFDAFGCQAVLDIAEENGAPPHLVGQLRRIVKQLEEVDCLVKESRWRLSTGTPLDDIRKLHLDHARVVTAASGGAGEPGGR
jgi:hypothetical protein